jgi:hypothetical protein
MNGNQNPSCEQSRSWRKVLRANIHAALYRLNVFVHDFKKIFDLTDRMFKFAQWIVVLSLVRFLANANESRILSALFYVLSVYYFVSIYSAIRNVENMAGGSGKWSDTPVRNLFALVLTIAMALLYPRFMRVVGDAVETLATMQQSRR